MVVPTYKTHVHFVSLLLASIAVYAEDSYPPIFVIVDREPDLADVGICSGANAWLCEELPIHMLVFEKIAKQRLNISWDKLPHGGAWAFSAKDEAVHCQNPIKSDIGDVRCDRKTFPKGRHPGRLHQGVKKYLSVLEVYKGFGCTNGIWVMDSDSFAVRPFNFANIFSGFRQQPWLVVENYTKIKALHGFHACMICDMRWRTSQTSNIAVPLWGVRHADHWMYKGAVLEDLMSTGKSLIDMFYDGDGTGDANLYLDFVVHRYVHGNPYGYRLIDQASAIERFAGPVHDKLCVRTTEHCYQKSCSSPLFFWTATDALPKKEADEVKHDLTKWMNEQPGQVALNGHCGGCRKYCDAAMPMLPELFSRYGWTASWCLSNCLWPNYWELLGCGAPRPGDSVTHGDVRSKVRQGQSFCRADLRPLSAKYSKTGFHVDR